MLQLADKYILRQYTTPMKGAPNRNIRTGAPFLSVFYDERNHLLHRNLAAASPVLFLKLGLASQRVAQAREEFVRFLNDVEQHGHAFDVERLVLYVDDDALAVVRE